jgi:2-succinyl-5-enolpyruvyl-6-hydroxy-3-cyclohexene-1-carboxylate synthase
MTAVDTYLLLRALCDELARCGLRHACTSPGSRCTPIVLSLVREPRIRCWSHIDERCAGFFALGAAKVSGRPVAVTCTSGTAAANLAPAVIEAHEARVPLIVLTADRPPELRDVGAGQTVDQLKLYGDAAKWFVEVGVHDAGPERIRWIRALACRAYWTAISGRPGPVHLNLPLREPLVLSEPLPDDLGGRPGGRPWVTRGPTTTAPRAPHAAPAPAAGAPHATPAPAAGAPHAAPAPPPVRGVVIAGRYERDGRLGDAVARFAHRVGYPLLADPLSGARHGPATIARYDLLLRDERFATRMRPQLVIRVGDLPTSKPLRNWLASLTDVAQLALDPEDAYHDPASTLTMIDSGDPLATLAAPDFTAPADPGWLAGWRAADEAATGAIAAALGELLSEPLVAARLGEWLPAHATLFVASSMPIRDVELFFTAAETAPRVLSNRGANGIDGTVSAAFGAAAASTRPVVLLIGDVALAHDIGGLLAGRRLSLQLTIVLLNNDGGGIFHFLPVAGETDAFEQHVATPHALDFSHAAKLYGGDYARPADADALQAAIARSLGSRTTTIIEVRTDRAQNLALHRRIADAALAAVRGTLRAHAGVRP